MNNDSLPTECPVEPFFIGFVEKPTKDQLYLIASEAEKVKTWGFIKLAPSEDQLEVIHMPEPLGMWKVRFLIDPADKLWWLGFLSGRTLGINIGKTNRDK